VPTAAQLVAASAGLGEAARTNAAPVAAITTTLRVDRARFMGCCPQTTSRDATRTVRISLWSPGLTSVVARRSPRVKVIAGLDQDGGVSDRFDLKRFVDAQGTGGVYADAVRELRAGRKQSHWMWFVFPQIAGLGRSATAQHFAISGLPEAEAYFAHPVLGPRLVECARVLTDLPGTDAVRVFGATDAQKLQSSMTLFAWVAVDEPAFRDVLDKYFASELDDGTTSRL
jgi:uncharacterized protein (DUF1810 family)